MRIHTHYHLEGITRDLLRRILLGRQHQKQYPDILNSRDETKFTDGIVMLQVKNGYFTTPQRKGAIIDIVFEVFQNTALEANCQYEPYTTQLWNEARALQPNPPITNTCA